MLEVFTGWPMLLAAFRALGLSPAMALAAVWLVRRHVLSLGVLAPASS